MSYKQWLKNLEKEIEEAPDNLTFKEAWKLEWPKFKKNIGLTWKKKVFKI